ncbi:MAG TPA: GNAT family N-acetyltransferase [Rhizomicrobium sp.]|jgi:CelD/BcsL family acetyltransferase involved in cellulose biosynthesis|nr:GNAT family N-acetyltransferase [Rhizomicrobium sp.]
MSGVEIIESEDRLAAIVPQWRELWSRVSATTPFQSPDWLLPWWDIFEPGELRVIAIWDNDTLIGIAPLYIDTTREPRCLLPLGISLSDYLDVALDPADFDNAAEGLSHAVSAMGDVALWEMREIPENGAALQLRLSGEWQHEDSPGSVCPLLVLPNGIADLGEHISPSRMRHLRTARRRAARRGETSIIVGDVDNADSLLAELVRLELLRWKGGVFSDQRVADFHAAALPGLMEHGVARMYALEIGEKTVGVWYGFALRACSYAYLCAYDPDYRFESPGAILIGHAIEEAIREGTRVFDFLRGSETYKYEWGARDRVNIRRVFRRRC